MIADQPILEGGSAVFSPCRAEAATFARLVGCHLDDGVSPNRRVCSADGRFRQVAFGGESLR